MEYEESIKEISQRIWEEAKTISYTEAESQARNIVASWSD